MSRTLRQTVAERRCIWIDYYRYAESLSGVTAPWLDKHAFIAFHTQIQSLLYSDVITLPVEAVADALVASDESLCRAMAAKSRSVYPLRRLLEEARLRSSVADLLGVLRAQYVDVPLALSVPSPRRWLSIAYETAQGKPLPPDAANDRDAIESASVYLADFLRGFAAFGVDVLLMVESSGEAPADTEQLAAYQAAIVSARHCGWETGLLDAGALTAPVRSEGLDFYIAPVDTAGDGLAGNLVGVEFFDGMLPVRLDQEQFYCTSIPVHAKLDDALKRLTELRGRF
ncbi:hypothetical protein [Pseudomonas jessenii]|uniref:hypothetical protein n=1 Tax=Pseudomonas jessenii TaxID=77298 RepID=UPI00389273AC